MVANTDVDSPDSLRSLVSRTKGPEDYPQAETKKVTPAQSLLKEKLMQ